MDDGGPGRWRPYRRTMDTITHEVGARELRSRLATLVNEAAYGGARVAVERYGTIVAVLVSADDFARLVRLESLPGALSAEGPHALAEQLIRDGQLQGRVEGAEARARYADERTEAAEASAREADRRCALALDRAAEAERRVADLERGFTTRPRATGGPAAA